MADTKVQVEGQWIDHISDKAASTLRDLRNEFSATSLAEKALGNLTADAIKEFIRGAAEKAQELTKLYVDQERAETRLSAALQKTGQARSENVDRLIDYASKMESATRFDDANIQAAETLALTLGKMRVDDVIPMTAAALDLASALGTDVTEAMRLLIRGGDGAAGALARVGIQFAATGDQAKDTAALLKLVREQFGGLAEKEMGPVERKLHEIDVAIEDNDKALGKNLSNFTIWLAQVRKGLSDAAVAWNDYHSAAEGRKSAAAFNDRAGGARGIDTGLKAYGAATMTPANSMGPWSLVDPSLVFGGANPAPGWRLPGVPYGGSVGFPTAANGISDATRASMGKAATPTPWKAPDWYRDMSRDPMNQGAGLSPWDSALAGSEKLGQVVQDLGEASKETNRALDEMIKAREEEVRKMAEAHDRAASVASTLIGGLRQVEAQGKITFDALGKMIARMLEDIAWQQAQRGLTSFLTNVFGGGGGSGDGGSPVSDALDTSSVDVTYAAARGRG